MSATYMSSKYNEQIRLYSTAKGYVQSAFLIMTNPYRYQLRDDTTFFLSFHMLTGFALELYLKAYLIGVGVDGDYLRAPAIRHDLRRLHQAAQDKGLDEREIKQLVDLLEEHHKTHEFRYMKPTSAYVSKELSSLFLAFSLLDNAVDTAVGASASRGLSAGGQWNIPAEYANWRFPSEQ